MKRFSFRLARVLELRRMESDMEQNKLAALEAQMEQLRDRLREITDAYQHQLSLVGTDPLERRSLAEFRLANERKQQACEKEIVRHQEKCQHQQTRVLSARQKVEVLEKVKSKQRQEWEKQLQKELDEMAMDSFLARWTPPPARRPS